MPSSARAHTTATSATEPLVIHIFEPLRIQSEPSRRARGAHAAGIGAEVRLGQPETADGVAGGHRGQPLLALLLAAVPVDGEHRQRALHRHQAAQAAVDGLELLADQPVGGGRRAAAPVALQVHPQHAELAQVGRQLTDRHLTRLEPLGDVRTQPLFAEPSDGLAQLDVLRRQQ